MFPVLIQTPFFTIYTYGVFVAMGFLAASWLLTKEAVRRGRDAEVLYNLSLVLLASGIIGARAFYVALNFGTFLENPLEIVMLHHGGLVWFGGLIGALVCGFIFLRLKNLPLLETCDLFAPYAALGQAIGRLGCFFNGCCHGRSVSWGIYFPVHDARLIPSQLIDAATLVAVFLLLRLCRPGGRHGEIFFFYLMLSGLQRFGLEFLRGDERPFYFGLSVFQWISISVFALGLFSWLAITWKRKNA